MWPDKINTYDLAGCCLLHDEDYDNQAGFIASNWRLYQCIRQSSPAWLALVMLAGTTLFGWYFYIKAKRD
jgi:hypothetical protein